MGNKYLLLAILLAVSLSSSAQGTWSPTTAPYVTDRYDDIYFINADTGWAACLDDGTYNQQGKILKTTDGGLIWDSTNAPNTSEYRDISFLDSRTGFTGTLQTSFYDSFDTTIMYTSTDGGLDWQPVTNLPGPRPAGVCGMRMINDSTLYACGRYFGPPGFYKTINKGASWSYVNLDSVGGGLVDAFFFGPDTGFIVGTTDTNFNIDFGASSSGIILYTTDAGDHWQRVCTTGRMSEMCWKLSFPSRLIGYASIESFRSTVDSQFCMKTTDGGLTWQEVYFCTNSGYSQSGLGGFDAQAIGFINDTVGWIGGRDTTPTGTEYKTTDGGNTWTAEHWGKNLNRFRFLNDGSAYVSGLTVYKYCNSPTVYDTAVICPGGYYSLGDSVFTQAGGHTAILQGGCDTTANLSLGFYPQQTPSITDSAGTLYASGGFLLYQWVLNNNTITGASLPSYVPLTDGTYYVYARDSNDCVELSANYVVTNVGTSSVTGTSFLLYPDPVYDRLVIAGLPEGSPIVITDIVGQVLMRDTYNVNTRSIDVSSLTAGVYFVNNKKFVKE